MLHPLLVTVGVAGVVAFLVGRGAYAVASGARSDGPRRQAGATPEVGRPPGRSARLLPRVQPIGPRPGIAPASSPIRPQVCGVQMEAYSLLYVHLRRKLCPRSPCTCLTIWQPT
jgi:hypothetical protein